MKINYQQVLIDCFQRDLLHWFKAHGRQDLPWQKDKTPYRVWVSEVMLQQTQVKTVIPYFERFMLQFPTLTDLALAPQDLILHLWTGLGYYSRARNLQRTAQIVYENYQGELPASLSELNALPGIGRSTAAAILAIAYAQKQPILDGNVKRVLTRFLAFADPINQKKIENQLWSIADRFMPSSQTADYTQAIMDLGATVCTRNKPLCQRCPLAKNCKAYQNNHVHSFPYKLKKNPIPTRHTTFLLVQSGNKVLLQRRDMAGVWQGLWSLPELQDSPDSDTFKKFSDANFRSATAISVYPSIKHTFSHYHLIIQPVLIQVANQDINLNLSDHCLWFDLKNPPKIGLPKPVHDLLFNQLPPSKPICTVKRS